MSVHGRAFGQLGVIGSFLLLPCIASAQSASSGTIAGTVKDATGAVIAGVTVEAASPALIEKTRSNVTDGQGNYKIVDLPPGVYTVTFTLSGFSTVRREDVELTTGFTANVSAEMKLGAVDGNGHGDRRGPARRHPEHPLPAGAVTGAVGRVADGQDAVDLRVAHARRHDGRVRSGRWRDEG